jgi:drug/metabolite transporter (DMT)-like permease
MERSNPAKAALWMMGAVVSFVAMAVAGRSLLVGMNTFELMLYRSLVGFAIVSVLVARSRAGFAQVRTAHLGLHLRRNLFHYAGQNLWFFAIGVVPLAQVVALEFTSPIWVALLAPLLLGEALTRVRLLAAVLGFAGVLVVAQPGRAPLDPGHFAALASAVGFALNTIFTRQIMRFDRVLCVLFWMTLLQGTASLVLSLPGGVPLPTADNLVWIVLVGVTGLSAHFALTSALGHAPASIVAPMEFVRLPLIAIVGAVLYGEPLAASVFVGAGLIVLGNLINLRAETRRLRA